VNSFDPPNFQDETVGLCEGNSITITVDSVLQVIYGTQVQIPILSLLPLLVNIPLPSPMLMVVQNKKKYTAIVSEIASITGTIVTDFSGEKIQ
jgi:hypothetical protein